MRAFFTRGIRGYKLPKPYRADCFSKGEHARYLQLMSIAQLQKQMKWPAGRPFFPLRGSGPVCLRSWPRRRFKRPFAGEPTEQMRRLAFSRRTPIRPIPRRHLALVCEFPRAVSDATLADCHRLAWLFVRAPLLITVEPHRVKTWTCCERPAAEGELPAGQGEITEAGLDLTASLSPSEQAAHALHWVRLASGDFYRQFPDRFRRDGRADRLLLEGLKYVRRRLQKQGLDYDRIHDLLARVVFSQFLFDRKDSDGRPALNAGLLSRLHEDGHLLQRTQRVGLDPGRLRGGIPVFPLVERQVQRRPFSRQGRHAGRARGGVASGNGGRPAPPPENAGRFRERPAPRPATVPLAIVLVRRGAIGIHQQHLRGVRHRQRGRTTRRATWSTSCSTKCCLGAAINGTSRFSIRPAARASSWSRPYQRLIQRWKNAHPDQKPSADDLRRILQRNLFGVDIDPHAVRVASFSLYLTMCDELDPKSYLNSTKFPPLRDQTLICADFFQEGHFRLQQQERRRNL